MGDDGLPAALMWIHVDDVAIHAPTRAKCHRALTAFLDATVRVGLLCHPAKLTPPTQVAKYCGFLYDTTGIPCLRIPQSKTDRAVATIEYLRSGAADFRLSRLTLAVTVGLLQSLVDATPCNVGQTYLRRLYESALLGRYSGGPVVGFDLLHPSGANGRRLARPRVVVPSASQRSLQVCSESEPEPPRFHLGRRQRSWSRRNCTVGGIKRRRDVHRSLDGNMGAPSVPLYVELERTANHAAYPGEGSHLRSLTGLHGFLFYG